MFRTKPLAASILARLTGAIVGATKAVVRAWVAHRNRRAVAQLLGYDEYMLRDIGVTRSDVEASLSGGPLDDASTRLGRLARERREGGAAQRREAIAEARRAAPVDGGTPMAAGVMALPRRAA